MTILCGTDLSLASDDALAVAVALATQRGEREVVLLHVVDPATASNDAAVERHLATARAHLAKVVAGQRSESPAIRTELRVGPPDQTMVTVAEMESCDLIVIAAASTTGGSLLKLGTTAQRVIARTHVPVIIVRDPKPWLEFARGERPLRVLLGVDDSATCDLVIGWLHALRRRANVDVVLGAIYYPDDAATRYGVEAKGFVDNVPEVELLLARDLTRRFGEGGLGEVIPRAKRGLGRIGDHLLELAREENVDAIVVGTGQKTGLGRLGSVSSIIVNDAAQSVVCVPPSAAIASGTIPILRVALVATDLSPFANRAVPYAFAMTQPDGEVHLIHVLKDDDEANETELNATLQGLAPRGASGMPTHRVITHVLRGDDAATVVAQAAARIGADVICIASHGRTGITRALVGSVADRLLRATRVPVLVLRPG
ncbi:MAG: universal stress protein [Deltaproteobacteria bacterium]|nr:universal stress protein [Deltaproteobacteria bacterium]